jgi:hypothetical protein
LGTKEEWRMSKTRMTARWTASTGASLVFMVAVALVAAPMVFAAPGDGGDADPIAALIGGDGPGFLGGGGGGMGGGQGVHGRAMSKGDTDTYGIGLQAHGEGDQAHGRLVFGHRGAAGDEGFGGEITCLSVGDDGVVQVSGTTREGRKHRHGDGHGRRGGHDGGGKEGEPGEEGGEEAQPAPAAFANGGRHGGGHGGDKEGKPEEGDKKGGKDGMGDEQPASQDFAFTILTKSDPQQFSLPMLAEKGSLTPCGGGDTTTVAVSRGGFRAHKG